MSILSKRELIKIRQQISVNRKNHLSAQAEISLSGKHLTSKLLVHRKAFEDQKNRADKLEDQLVQVTAELQQIKEELYNQMNTHRVQYDEYREHTSSVEAQYWEQIAELVNINNQLILDVKSGKRALQEEQERSELLERELKERSQENTKLKETVNGLESHILYLEDIHTQLDAEVKEKQSLYNEQIDYMKLLDVRMKYQAEEMEKLKRELQAEVRTSYKLYEEQRERANRLQMQLRELLLKLEKDKIIDFNKALKEKDFTVFG